MASTRVATGARVAAATKFTRKSKVAESGGPPPPPSASLHRNVRCDCSSSGSDSSNFRDRPGAGLGFGTGYVGREASTLHKDWIDAEFDKVPLVGDANDPYGPDAETQRRVKLVADYERRLKAMAGGIGAEVKEKLRGVNVYVVGSDDDNNSFLSTALSRVLDYSHFTSNELCLKCTGLNRTEVYENEGDEEMYSFEVKLMRSFNQVQNCCVGTLGLPGGASSQQNLWPVGLDGGITVWIEDTIGDVEGSDAYSKADVALKCKPLKGLEKFLGSAENADKVLHDISRAIEENVGIIDAKLKHAETNSDVAE